MAGQLRTMISNNRFLITGIAAAIVYWVVESIAMVLAFGADGFVQELFRADPHELWMRSLATLMIVGFGAYAQQANTRIHRTQGALSESEERNRVEKALRMSEERFSQIFEEGPMGMAMSDAEGRFVRVNDRLCEMLGYGEGELVGLTLNDLADPEDSPLDRATVARLNSGEVRSFKTENRYLTKHGESLWCDATIARLLDEGTSVRWVSMLEDITTRRRMEEELRQSEELHRATLTNISDAVFITDPSGDFSYVCPNVHVIFGCQAAEIGELGNISELLGNDLVPHEDLGNIGEIRNLECQIMDWSGERHDLLVNMKPVQIGDGTALYTCRDVTERRLMQQQALISLKEKDMLLQEIHHRVKNNLQVISSILDMSSLRIQDEQAIGLLTDARAKVHTMGLIHSQLYHGERFDRINMNSHVRDLAQYLSLIYGEGKDVNVTVHAGDVDLSLTQAIPCALALSELVSNSFKHAFKERHGGSLEITVEDAPGNTIVLTVKDDGCGLPDEVDFFHADSLGLKLVRNLVQNQLRGSVQVNRDAGTEFVVTFQREEETDVESPRG